MIISEYYDKMIQNNIDKKCKVLLVDDEYDMVKTISVYLKLFFNFDTVYTTSPIKALEIFDDSIDLIISDYNMPLINGIEMIRAIRQREDRKKVRIIILSGDINKITPEIQNELKIWKTIDKSDFLNSDFEKYFREILIENNL